MEDSTYLRNVSLFVEFDAEELDGVGRSMVMSRFAPDDTILDAPVTFQTPSGPYTPHNFDEKFEGTITLRRALAQSRNIPALKLADQAGIKKVIEYAHRFGITSNLPPYLPVAIGAAEVTLYEQTSAFSFFLRMVFA